MIYSTDMNNEFCMINSLTEKERVSEQLDKLQENVLLGYESDFAKMREEIEEDTMVTLEMFEDAIDNVNFSNNNEGRYYNPCSVVARIIWNKIGFYYRHLSYGEKMNSLKRTFGDKLVDRWF